ncbi:unnamed protein product [Amaranthus hypochondriacus]
MAPRKQPLQPITNKLNIPTGTTTTTTTTTTTKHPNIGDGKCIEDIYQKKTQLEHILLRPDTYIGSTEKLQDTLWTYISITDDMSLKQITYVPGLYKIFDEILVNAADNKQRDPKMDRIEVMIDQEQNLISVYNTGDGIPVEIHKEETIYIPELIFGHLLTSSNYNDNEKKTTGGRNGYGAKLTNIFSTEFIIETADGKRRLKYKQVFRNNMSHKGDPVIQNCKPSENWTKVTFKPDLSKFNMTHLEDDVVALMNKRVVDLAGCLAASPGKKVKVFLNSKEIETKTFYDYAQLYLNTVNINRDFPLVRIDNNNKEDYIPRWQISVCMSEGQFQQVSFVNSINTIKGGTHVDYITGQITKCVIEAVNKKKKNANLKPHIVKNYLWVFVNALIDNPAFDSQTKETLTTRANNFGTTCELSDKFLRKVVNDSGVVDRLITWADFKEKKDLKKSDGSKTRRLLDIPKLEDANEAGGSKSHKCTLIITEGDSAKALAMSGLSVVGRNYYGVFPLRGKLLNVREASAKQITENAEINNLKKILGLKQGEKYDKDSSLKLLRYGHLMIMADQDHDGSHIKGLVINFIHTFWPSLLKNPSFMLEFITPIVKATRSRGKDDTNVLSFYSMLDYEDWVRKEGSNVKNWHIKYYKGLGTSDAKEGKEYFANLDMHRKIFTWEDNNDCSAIELAFSKKKIEARKDWLREAETGSVLDHKEERVRYSDFINKELKLFSRADLQRSIPSMVDGFKPTQRKVLFSAFKRNLVKEIKVAQFSGYVSEKSAYHHGEASIQGTIVNMAQNFVGANNVNFLMPNGQFGTRNLGGKDAASARYIHTQLSELTRFLFPKEDDLLLTYLKEDNLSIEPIWYMPIIPTILVSGSEGIGTGWSTFIPNYNPKDIIANIRRLLKNDPLIPMDPWYRKFKGTIQKTARKDTGVTYTVTGIIDVVDDYDGEDICLRISELPVRKWTQDYKEFLSSLAPNQNDKSKEPFIKDFHDHSTDETACFDVILNKQNYSLAIQEGLTKKFKLTTNLSTSNMNLFDKDNKIVRYESPEQILETFFVLRLEYYAKRKAKYLEIYQADLVKLNNQVRFAQELVSKELVLIGLEYSQIVNELRERGYDPFPMNKAARSSETNKDSEDIEEQDNNESLAHNINDDDYDYLLSFSIKKLSSEKIMELCSKRDKMQDQIEWLKNETERSLWARDLDALDRALNERDLKEEEEAKRCIETMKASVQKAKKPRKNVMTKPKPIGISTTTITEAEQPLENLKGKSKVGSKKATTKKDKPYAVEIEEDDDFPELRARIAVMMDYSPDKTEMETDAPKVDTKKTSIEEISDDDDDFKHEISKPRRGNPATKKALNPSDGTKKRGPTRKMITDSSKVSEAIGTSPEKKVRRMRPSPFNKKSGSALNNVENGDIFSFSINSIDEMTEDEAVPAKPRPHRANKKQVTYVVSDDDDDDDDDDDAQPLSDDDFDVEDDDSDF